MKSNRVDEIDRKIIHGLSIDGRASFRALGEVSGCSDQTAARRFRRMQETIELRVLGDAEATRVGWDDWLVRLRCTPGGTAPVAGALARRPDTRWVQLASGGTEIVCVIQARTHEQRDALLLRGLPGSRHVVQVSAHLLLEAYSPEAWSAIASALTPEEAARLAPAPLEDAVEPVRLGRLDEALLECLARDGRAPYAEIAATIHAHESTVRRRIDELRRVGALSFEVDLDTSGFGLDVHAFLWLSVDPARLEWFGRALADHPEVAFAAATTGQTNLFASLVCRDTRHLFEYLNTRLQSLPGIRTVETAPVIRTIKRTGQRPSR